MKHYKQKYEALMQWLRDRKQATGLNKKEKKDEKTDSII